MENELNPAMKPIHLFFVCLKKKKGIQHVLVHLENFDSFKIAAKIITENTLLKNNTFP